MEKTEIDIAKDLNKLHIDSKTIFVTHAPACGILDTGYDGSHYGSKSISSFLLKNNVLLHTFGHIHQSFGFQKKNISMHHIPSIIIISKLT